MNSTMTIAVSAAMIASIPVGSADCVHAADQPPIVGRVVADGRFFELSFNSKGDTLIGSDLFVVRTWRINERGTTPVAFATDVPMGTETRGLRETVSLSPNGSQLATMTRGSDRKGLYGNQIVVLATTDWSELRRFDVQGMIFNFHLAFSTDGKSVIAAGRGRSDPKTERQRGVLLVGDIATGKIHIIKNGEGRPFDSIAVSPRDEWCAIGDGVEVVLISTDTWKDTKRLTSNGLGTIQALAISHSGGLIAAGGYGERVCVWDAESGKERAIFSGHVGAAKDRGHIATIHSIAFSPNDRLIATASNDQTVRVWDWKENRETARFDCKDHAWSVAFSPDGRLLAASVQGYRLQKGEIVLWRVP